MAYVSGISDKEKQRAVDDYRAGVGIQEIAKRLRVSASAIYQWKDKDTAARNAAAQIAHLSPDQLDRRDKRNLSAQLEVARKRIAELQEVVADKVLEIDKLKKRLRSVGIDA